MAVSVGIDLGTTFSAVAYIDPQTKLPKIIPNLEGNKITPSVIQFAEGKAIFGSQAESAFKANEPGCVASFKRGMGKREAYCTIEGASYSAEELSALLLRHLKEDAEAELADTIQDAVVTVPAYFNTLEREATLRAASAAGLKVKKIIDEPNAAAMAYGLNNWRENANILVYDLGGGTFDVTLIRMGQDGELITIATRGDRSLGGKDWDDRVERILLDKFADHTGVDTHSNQTIITMLRGMSEGVKKQLTALDNVKVTANIPGFGLATVVVSKQDFEDKTADLIDRTGALCRAVLEEAGLNTNDITDVLLVGGSTRMPQVSQYLLKLFGKKPIAHVHPDEAVALGAAIQATKENESYVRLSMQVTTDGKKVTDRSNTGLSTGMAVKPKTQLSGIGALKLRETTAHAMGIIAINDEENRYYNDIIIPANHPRPVRFAKNFIFYTSKDSNNELEIYLLQGDSENPLDCIIPHKYVVTGIRHVKRGEKLGTLIRIQYSYDHNGIIRIQARQEDGTVDLPIRNDDVPADMSKYGLPVRTGSSDTPDFSTSQLRRNLNQDVVHKYKAVTFSNVEWKKYDNISHHPSGAAYGEPAVHVIANEETIEFHGYNISEMDEGVYYYISADDDFEIECDINTSEIKPHPGGNVIITLGIITARLDQYGGNILLDGNAVATVGPRFKLRITVTNGGHYGIYIDGKLAGSQLKPSKKDIEIRFGLTHGSHNCELLSHAFVSDIMMIQGENKGLTAKNNGSDDVASTWDD